MNLIVAMTLALIGLAVFLFVLNTKRNTINKAQGILGAVTLNTWWVLPTLFWFTLNAIVYWYFNELWSFIWNKQLIFWVLQAGHFILLYRGRNIRGADGKPIEALYPTVLAITFFCTVLLALCWGEHRIKYVYTPQPVAPRPISVQPSAKSVVAPRPVVKPPAVVHPKQQEKSVERPAPSPAPKVTPPTPVPTVKPEPPRPEPVTPEPRYAYRPNYYISKIQNKVVVIYPNTVATEFIPPGYHVSHIDGLTFVMCRQRSLYGGGTEFQFRTVARTPIRVTIWYEPDRP